MLADLPPTTLIGWVSRGIITPNVVGDSIRGAGHKFDLMTTVGIVAGSQLWGGDVGCHPRGVTLVVEAFRNLGEAILLSWFAKRATHLLAAWRDDAGKALVVLHEPTPKLPKMINMLAIYQAVKAMGEQRAVNAPDEVGTLAG